MAKNDSNKTDSECNDLLKFIFDGSVGFYIEITPNGWANSEFVFFLHPTPQQQYAEYIRMRDNINRLTKKKDVEDKNIEQSDFKQDDLTGLNGMDEFLFLLGLCVYDIFSNNHEVVAPDKKIYDLGSMRGSGRFIADFLNNESKDSKKYDYIDFYMGTIWVSERGTLLPFYEFVFKN